ncbi:DNA-directed RNA polymerase III subunit C1 (rpo31) [Entomophthora muscae]|uniref:DNA-directed RNA polymerase III subunit C1 (Rpo31) n=1 Tax=Entomophthora muscae TaxID=34485 RepID=A0ACC2UAZ5_9FUNG|nr:DNA-directed RNA polymerase III subunit C1 (rpo31) [Entomophthora muscae]
MKDHVSHLTPKRIKHIQFNALNPEEIKTMSLFELTTPDLFMPNSNRAERFGPLDERMGISDKVTLCETCGLNLQECMGHFAHIDFPLPIFHIGFFQMTLKTLQCICKSCSRLLLEEPDRRKYLASLRRPGIDNTQKMEQVKKVIELCKKAVVCPYCSNINGGVKRVGVLKLIHDKFKAKTKAMDEKRREFYKKFEPAVAAAPELKPHIAKASEDLNPLVVYNLFQNINSEDCELLGFDPARSRPERLLWTSIPVPPVCIRPTVLGDAGRNVDDLTAKIGEMIIYCKNIRTGIEVGAQEALIMDAWESLQLCVALYINPTVPGFNPTQDVKPIRSLCARLKGKQGRFRGNLSGKRVDFSGRTVISPDPNLRIDQIAVPELIAKVLTYPERVTYYNKSKLQQFVKNGAMIHPGANAVDFENEKKFLKLKPEVLEKIARSLKIGDVVHRHLMDDDIVLFNRQPSLHRLSIMAHLVKVRPWRTLRFNECVCNPYNADFDGDEMNLHVPQTEEARIEAYELMGVKNNLVTPRNGEPLIAAIQDFITASYLLTKKDRFYDRSQFTQICSYMGDALMHFDLPPPTIIKPVRLWTGKQIFNVLIRPTRNCPIVVNLESKCRSFTKPKGALPDMCLNDGYLVIRNSEIMCGVMDKATVGDGNKKSLFYVILRDYGAVQTAECMNRLAKLCCRWLGNHGFSLGINDVMPGTNLLRRKHNAITTAYQHCDDLIHQHKIGQLTPQAGCNEDETLEAQISGTLSKVRDEMGQVCIDELNKYNAPLTMALCGSKGSKINVCQMVACVGQQIISGSRIPDGFEDRSLPHFLKKSKIPAAKGFVKNSFYSGLSPTEFFFHAISGREGLVDTAVKTAETGYMQRRLIKALEDLTTNYDLSVRNSEGGLVQFTYGDDGLDPIILEGDGFPVEFTRNLEHIMHTNPPSRADVPLAVHAIVSKTKEILSRVEFTSACNPAFLESTQDFITNNVVNKIANIRVELGLSDGLDAHQMEDDVSELVKQVNQRCYINEKQLEKFLEVCRIKYLRAKVEPGTAVGAIGAQSIGEPGTQMTLKTFHFAGVASMNVTLGVPRIGEIINAAKKINTPIITSKLVNDSSEISARIVKARIERTTLGDVAEFIEEVYQPDVCYLGVRIDFKAIRLLQLETTLGQIADALCGATKPKLRPQNVTINPPNRIRILVPQSDPENYHYDIQTLKRQLAAINIVGFADVRRAVISLDKDKKFSLLVEGYGLLKVMTTNGIVGEETTSNHVMEVKQVLGIEAARNSIIYEIQYTMSTHGMTIDPRHIMLLGDVMTFKGEVLGITRGGIAKMKDSVLMLASFEMTTDHLFNAAMYSRRDTIEGVSECIIMGITMPIGTGLFELLQSNPKPLPPPRELLFDVPELHKPLSFD